MGFGLQLFPEILPAPFSGWCLSLEGRARAKGTRGLRSRDLLVRKLFFRIDILDGAHKTHANSCGEQCQGQIRIMVMYYHAAFQNHTRSGATSNTAGTGLARYVWDGGFGAPIPCFLVTFITEDTAR